MSARLVSSVLPVSLARIGARLGVLKRTWAADGVRYTERSGGSLRRALAQGGPGVKEYDARFTDADPGARRTMKIRCTRSRVYHDLIHDPRVDAYAPACEIIRPGERVLEIGCGTGAGSAMLHHAVGPSGGVVSIDRDGESIRFARMRYPCGHGAFELGWIESLAGEPDGSFDAVIGVDPLAGASDDPQRARDSLELARVVRRGGWVLLVALRAGAPDAPRERLLACGLEEDPSRSAAIGRVGAALLLKPDRP